MSKTQECAVCSKKATQVCEQCFGVWYCGESCLKDDHLTHQEDCDREREAMLVERTGKLAQQMCFMILERFNMMNTTRHCVLSDKVVFEDSPLHDQDSVAIVPLPKLPSQALRYAHLSIRSCDQVLYLSQQLVKHLLLDKEYARSAWDIAVTVNRRPKPASHVNPSIYPEPGIIPPGHRLFLINMPKSDWVLDITRPQYGFLSHPPLRLEDFSREIKLDKDDMTRSPFNSAPTATLEWDNGVPSPRALKLRLHAADEINKLLVNFTYEGLSLVEFLTKSQQLWNAASNDFFQKAKVCVDDYIRRLHGPLVPSLKRDEHGVSRFTNPSYAEVLASNSK